MNITVYPPLFVKTNVEKLDKNNNMVLKEGAKVADVYRSLGIPLIASPVMFCKVNLEKARPSDRLSEGDIVTFGFVPIAGG